MMKIRRRRPRSRDLTSLESLQRTIAGVPPYDPRVREAWSSFSGKPIYQRVRQAVEYQSAGKCVYCERNEVQGIDHFYPKLQFPTLVFAYWNFSGACSTCNLHKAQPLIMWQAGPMLVNPADEDPADFFYIDPRSGRMEPALHLDNPDPLYVRASYTIKKLRLNRRTLVKERKLMADMLQRALRQYQATGSRDAEDGLLLLMRERNQLRAVVRQLLTNPPRSIAPLVRQCLERSARVRLQLQSLHWL